LPIEQDQRRNRKESARPRCVILSLNSSKPRQAFSAAKTEHQSSPFHPRTAGVATFLAKLPGQTIACLPENPTGKKIMSTIMLVDDSATILLSISSILAKAGYSVEKAANAEEALRKFNAGVKIKLLITDLNMPGMNGIELIREVRKLAAYKFVPILFLTTESQQSKKLEAKAAGASGWIVKPASAEELLSTIKLVIR
jgi:two-component system chemotaxis response regulator CheY